MARCGASRAGADVQRRNGYSLTPVMRRAELCANVYALSIEAVNSKHRGTLVARNDLRLNKGSAVKIALFNASTGPCLHEA